MAIRFDDIGNRLKAFRLGSGLSADEIANRLGISRTALYRFEKGELAKIETLESLAELLSVSVPTLLGVGVEYIASAVAYFERTRQIEQDAEHIIVLAGPISYLLASDVFDQKLPEVLRHSIPEDSEDRERPRRRRHDHLGVGGAGPSSEGGRGHVATCPQGSRGCAFFETVDRSPRGLARVCAGNPLETLAFSEICRKRKTVSLMEKFLIF